MSDPHSFTCFDGTRLLASGTKADVAIAFRRASDAGAAGPLLIFDDSTGRSIDLDLRGSEAQIAKRYALATEPFEDRAAQVSNRNGTDEGDEGAEDRAKLDVHEDPKDTPSSRGRGRPKLGVVAREITLLPRHWDWLGAQPGGASVALRKLVDEARHAHADRDRLRDAQQRAYHFMSAMAGDYSGFEEASRALFAMDMDRLRRIIDGWPADVKAHVERMIGA